MTHRQASMFLFALGGLALGVAVSSGDGYNFGAAAILLIAAVWQSSIGKN